MQIGIVFPDSGMLGISSIVITSLKSGFNT